MGDADRSTADARLQRSHDTFFNLIQNDPMGVYVVDSSFRLAQVSAGAQNLLVEFGVDPRVWTHAMSTPKESLYLFTPEELAELKLATKVEDTSRAPDPGS